MMSTLGASSASAVVRARLVLCEDLAVNGFLAARTPLALSTWRGRTGLSELPRLAAPIDWCTWARRVQCEPAHFQSYAQAVYAATDAYLLHEQPESATGLLKAVLLTVSMRAQFTP